MKWLARVGMLIALAMCLTPPRTAAAVTASDANAILFPRTERWRVGYNLEGSADYARTIGRALRPGAFFSAAGAETDHYFVFPANARERWVGSAAVNVLERSGSYSGDVTLALEALRMDGTPRTTLSTVALDLEALTLGEWIEVALPPISQRQLTPGDVLAFHIHLSGAGGEVFEISPIFEARFTQTPYSVFLPAIHR